jgi:alanine-synthesizing transaminase
MNDSKQTSFSLSLESIRSKPLATLNALKLKMLKAGEELFDLSMINPDLSPPRFLVDKLLEASFKGYNHRYAVSRGIRKLREGFSQKYQQKFGVSLDPETEVCVTMGTKEALHHALMCLRERYSTLVMAAPSYPAHLSIARLLGFDLKFFKLEADEKDTLEKIRKLVADSQGVLLLNFPNNPTGVIVSGEFYAGLARILDEGNSDFFVLNDFVYGEMGFRDEKIPSLLSVPALKRVGAESYSLSKAYSVPGWRVGALLGQKELIEDLGRLKSHIDYGVFLPLQIAAAAALSSAEDLVKPISVEYHRRCALISSGLRSFGWELKEPKAGACVWARVPSQISGLGSIKAAYLLLSKTGILAMPGRLFGEEYEEWMRFAAVLPEEKIRKALRRTEELRF